MDGWAFNDRVPPDADSTIWVCRLSRTLDPSTDLRPALAFLLHCQRSDGGVATYPSEEGVRRSMRLPPHVSCRGWLQSHACVTAAAAVLPELGCLTELRSYLRRAQRPDGSWQGYWWPDPDYPTALAVEALRQHGAAEDLPAIQAALAWTHAHPPRPSAFALACALRILRDDPPRCRELADSLARLQNDDGSWPSSARIRIPPPDVLNPAAIWNWSDRRYDIYSIRPDHARLFTTATVLSALLSLS